MELIKIQENDKGDISVITNELHDKMDVFEYLENECTISDFMDWFDIIPVSKQIEIQSFLYDKNLLEIFGTERVTKQILNGLLTMMYVVRNKKTIVGSFNFDIIKIKENYYLEVDENSLISILGIVTIFIDSEMNKLDGKYLISINTIIVLQNVYKWFQEKYYTKTKNEEKKGEQLTYVMIDTSLNLYKIGKSKEVAVRERTLMAQKPTIKCILFLSENIESHLHKKYSEKRVRGEWFKLNDNDILDLISEYNFKPYNK